LEWKRGGDNRATLTFNAKAQAFIEFKEEKKIGVKAERNLNATKTDLSSTPTKGDNIYIGCSLLLMFCGRR